MSNQLKLLFNNSEINLTNTKVELIDLIPDSKDNSHIFQQLASEDSYKIKVLVSTKASLNDDTIKLLLSYKQHEITKNILTIQRDIYYKDNFIKYLEDIIKSSNPILCQIIAKNFKFLYTKTTTIITGLCNHPDVMVRNELLVNITSRYCYFNHDVLEILVNDPEPDISSKAKLLSKNQITFDSFLDLTPEEKGFILKQIDLAVLVKAMYFNTNKDHKLSIMNALTIRTKKRYEDEVSVITSLTHEESIEAQNIIIELIKKGLQAGEIELKYSFSY
jgi:hypothetical protein